MTCAAQFIFREALLVEPKPPVGWRYACCASAGTCWYGAGIPVVAGMQTSQQTSGDYLR